MVFDSLKNFGKYTSLNANFATVQEFLLNNNLEELEAGKHKVSDEVFVISEKVSAKNRENAVLEAHRNYIDVQLCLNSVDNMGWTSLDDCQSVKDEYDSERDLVFFNDEIQKQISVTKENFVIFFPWDAHAPNIGSGELHKIIFKVKV